MKKSNSKSKALGAFKKLGAVSLITATIFFVACKQTSGGGGGGKQGAPFVEGGASLILSPDNLTIKVKATTADGSAITVEGCKETELASDVETTLNAKGTKVILKGKITELSCGRNKLTALNVQGLTYLQELKCSENQLTELDVEDLISLQELYCGDNQLPELNVHGCTSLKKLKCLSNKLNAKAMTALLNALPAREAGGGAFAVLYTEETDIPEGNHKDYSQPEDLKKAFEGAKKRNWTLMKLDHRGKQEVL